jgi:predicted MFS family arabinose efflux permease
MITFASAFGSMGMKWATATILRRFGFRTVLVINSFTSAAFLAVCAAFTENTPVLVMVLLLFIGGFFRSLQFTSVNTMAYADVEPDRVSRATSLVSVAQQLAMSFGVAVGAMAVELTVHLKGGGALQAADFRPAIVAVAIISALSVLTFLPLSAQAGAEMTARAPAPPSERPAE